MIEFAICLPLFVVTIYGICAVLGLLRVQQQMILVTHAVVREAAAGLSDAVVLTRLANAYARAMGARRLTDLNVSVESAENPGNGGLVSSLVGTLARGSRIRVSGRASVFGPFSRLWPRGLSVEYSSVCLIDPWRSPVSKLMKMFKTTIGFSSR